MFNKENFFIWIKAITYLYKSSPKLFMVYCFFISLNAFIPTAQIIILKSIIDNILYIDKTPINIIFKVSLWGGLFFVSSLLSLLISLIYSMLSDKIVFLINSSILEKTSHIKDMYNFENPEFLNQIGLLKSQANIRPVNLLANFQSILYYFILFFSLLFVLMSFNWFLPFIIIFSLIPYLVVMNIFNSNTWRNTLDTAINNRKMLYYSGLALSKRHIKENLLFNNLLFFKNLFKNNVDIIWYKSNKNRLKRLILSIPALLFNLIGCCFAIYLIIKGLFSKTFSYGDIFLLFSSLYQLNSAFMSFFEILSFTNILKEYFKVFFNFLSWENKILIAKEPKVLNKNYFGSIEFKNISFKYPNSSDYILKNISFTINNNIKLAIVGENGSGKSTLIKLLLRYYDPSEGEILYNNVNIKDYNIDEWRSIISAVFQDFGDYYTNIIDNIKLADISKNEKDNLILDMLKNFNLNYSKETYLGKEFGGVELSGGQWQSLAIARAFYRNTSIIILDEPTASIDPLLEEKVYNNFLELSKNKVSILITHRLNSVVNVDRILVLYKGELVEQGSHLDLLKNDGLYKKMFVLQAKKYQN